MHSSIKESDFLFQKLGATWYVFAEIQGEVIYTALPQDIDPRESSFEFYQILEKQLNQMGKLKTRPPESAA